MPDLTATVPHQLGRAEAKQRLQKKVADLRQHGTLANFQDSWSDDTMTFSVSAMGQSMSGQMTVDDAAVHVTIMLPALLNLMGGTIKQQIETEARLLLGPKAKTVH
jgi:Putative polyhydroxyalkanoic acid system protein (PHA_gran_rgn)